MKKYFIIILTIISTFIFISCEEELTIDDPSTLGVDQFITDGDTALLALFNAYDDIQSRYVVGAEPKMFQGLYSDELNHTGSFPHLAEVLLNNIIAVNDPLSDIFSNHYDIINTTTEVIRLTDELDETQIDADIKEEIIAEAHALRAYGYFRLVKVFGGLPITEQTVPLDGDQANNTPRSSEAEVYNYILSEISLAEGKLASNNPVTRFTNNAVQVLKADVLLFKGNFTAAENVLAPIIANYSLTSTYGELFENGNNSSTILRIDFSPTDINLLETFFIGRHEVAPSQALLDAFESGDLRKNKISGNDPNTASITKWITAEAQPYIYRYADVLLMYSEVLARRNDASAASFIDLLRNRAGLGPIGSLNSTNFVDIIAQERMVEFYAENHRWEDVKRLGLAQQIIESKGLNFQAKQLLWPIPQDELNTNSLMDQSDQNPGY